MEGIIIGLVTFVIIGLFHPLVIYGEYYFTKKIWPVFLIAGFIFLGLAFINDNVLVSAVFGVIAFSCFWSIQEIIEQEQRVKKGWFPKKPERN